MERLWVIADLLLLVVIIFGNFITILAVRLSRKIFSVTSNHLILSLAIADLLTGFTVLYHTCFHIFPHLHYNKYTCLTKYFTQFGSSFASCYNVVAIAVDRFIAIIYPLYYPQYMTKNVVFILIAVIWSVCWLISAVPYFWNIFNPVKQCSLNLIIPRYYIVAIMTPMFLTAWFSILILYWRIWKKARAHVRRTKARSQEMGQDGPDSHLYKSNQIVLPILGCFTICWMPYVALAILQVLHMEDKPSLTAYHVVYWIAMCNAGINPFIYAWKNRNFREAFRSLLKFKLPDQNDYNANLNQLRNQTRLTERRAVKETNVCVIEIKTSSEGH